jgi:predicted RNA polymerase sigma factor
LPNARGDRLIKLDHFDKARTEFERAASLQVGAVCSS